VITSCCDWLSEFLHAHTSVLIGIKDVVSVGDDSRLKEELDIERLVRLWTCVETFILECK